MCNFYVKINYSVIENLYMNFPIFNLNQFEQVTGFKRKKLSENLDRLCQNLGFLIITEHQILREIISNQWKAVANFFFTKIRNENKGRSTFSRISIWMDST